MLHRGLQVIIQVFEHYVMLLTTLFLSALPDIMVTKVRELEIEFHVQRMKECICGLDDILLTESSLSENVGITVIRLTNRNTITLVSMPDYFAPVVTLGIKRATVVEDYCRVFHVYSAYNRIQPSLL